MDLALQAVENPSSQEIALCVRRGFLSVPHNLAEDRPLDVFITNLFEHAYEHPWVSQLRLRWWLSTVVIRGFLFLSGSSVGFNQWACAIEPTKRGYHIINKSHGAMKHLNVPIKAQSLVGRLWIVGIYLGMDGGLTRVVTCVWLEVCCGIRYSGND